MLRGGGGESSFVCNRDGWQRYEVTTLTRARILHRAQTDTYTTLLRPPSPHYAANSSASSAHVLGEEVTKAEAEHDDMEDCMFPGQGTGSLHDTFASSCRTPYAIPLAHGTPRVAATGTRTMARPR